MWPCPRPVNPCHERTRHRIGVMRPIPGPVQADCHRGGVRQPPRPFRSACGRNATAPVGTPLASRSKCRVGTANAEFRIGPSNNPFVRSHRAPATSRTAGTPARRSTSARRVWPSANGSESVCDLLAPGRLAGRGGRGRRRPCRRRSSRPSCWLNISRLDCQGGNPCGREARGRSFSTVRDDAAEGVEKPLTAGEISGPWHRCRVSVWFGWLAPRGHPSRALPVRAAHPARRARQRTHSTRPPLGSSAPAAAPFWPRPRESRRASWVRSPEGRGCSPRP